MIFFPADSSFPVVSSHLMAKAVALAIWDDYWLQGSSRDQIWQIECHWRKRHWCNNKNKSDDDDDDYCYFIFYVSAILDRFINFENLHWLFCVNKNM